MQQASLVINYDFPREVESYLHRIGRGGRFGRKGYAINFVVNQRRNERDSDRSRHRDQNDYQNFKRVIEFYDTQIDLLPENVKEAFS